MAKQLIKKDLYDANVYAEIVERVGRLEPTSTPNWGKMTSAQMLAHCTEVIAVMNGKNDLKSPFHLILMRPIVRRVVFGTGPYLKSAPTSAQYIQTEEKDFEQEKQNFLAELDDFVNMDKDKAASLTHPYFGKIKTLEDRNWAMYKHTAHHLEQFGI